MTSRAVRQFNRVPLLARVLLILMVPVSFLAALSGTVIAYDLSSRKTIHSVYNYVNVTALVVDRLQIERGQSSSFLAPACPALSNCSISPRVTLDKARNNSRIALDSFRRMRESEASVAGRLVDILPEYGVLLESLEGTIAITRSQVDDRVLTSGVAIKTYTLFI